jgi:hypothetical protein
MDVTERAREWLFRNFTFVAVLTNADSRFAIRRYRRL